MSSDSLDTGVGCVSEGEEEGFFVEIMLGKPHRLHHYTLDLHCYCSPSGTKRLLEGSVINLR